MTTFVFKDPDGRTHEVVGPDGATQEQAFQVLQQRLGAAPEAPAAPAGGAEGSWAAPAPTLGESAARQGKLFVRALASAAASPLTTAGNALNKIVNAGGELVGHNPNLQMPGAMLQKSLTAAGLPVPETGIEKFTQNVSENAPQMALPGGVVPQMVGGAAMGAANAAPGQEVRDATFGAAAGGAPSVLANSAKLLGGGVANMLGVSTGAGGESLKQAFKGGDDFVANMRGNVEPAAVVEQAKSGVQNMRQQMYDAYKNAKGGWAGDTTPMSFAPIGQAFDDAVAKFSFKGIPRPGTPEVQAKVEKELVGWLERARKDPSFLTVEGMDALKRHLSDIVPTDITNRTGRAFVTEVVEGVKKAIIAEKPQYAAAMKDYWAKSTQLDEISRSLSLGEKATVDTALRKLQSLMRNNVNSNFGQRLKSAEALAAQGGQDVLPAVAGQALNSWTPRGLQGLGASGAATGAVLTSNPWALSLMPAASPRMMGEAANVAGRVVRALTPEERFAEMLRRASSTGARAFQQSTNQE